MIFGSRVGFSAELRDLHTRTAVARLPLRQLGFLALLCLRSTDHVVPLPVPTQANCFWPVQTCVPTRR